MILLALRHQRQVHGGGAVGQREMLAGDVGRELGQLAEGGDVLLQLRAQSSALALSLTLPPKKASG
jgi:hypothetical protein